MSIRVLTECDDCKKIEECHVYIVEAEESIIIKFYYCDRCKDKRIAEGENYD